MVDRRGAFSGSESRPEEEGDDHHSAPIHSNDGLRVANDGGVRSAAE